MDKTQDKDCIFCQIIAGEMPAYVIHETDEILVFLSLENHPLVIPKKHYRDLYDLDQKLGGQLIAKTARVAQATKQALKADATKILQLNGSAAGQIVFHLHFHVYPCYEGKSPLQTDNQSAAYKQKLVTQIKTELDKLKGLSI